MKKLYLFAALLLGSHTVLAKLVVLKNKLVYRVGNDAYAMNPDGTEQKRVWQVPKSYGKFGGFSRDGKQAISYNNYNLYIHELTTGRFRNLLVWSNGQGTFIDSPSFSPDGKQVLCTVGERSLSGSDCYILLLDAAQKGTLYGYGATERAGITPENLTTFSDQQPPRFNLYHARWSADGKQIIFDGGPEDNGLSPNYGDHQEVCVMNKDGSQARRLTTNNVLDEWPIWNRRQDKITFVRRFTNEKRGEGYIAVDGRDLFIMNSDGTGEKSLTHYHDSKEAQNNYDNLLLNPVFNLAGTQIAFTLVPDVVREDIFPHGIYRINVDGKNLSRLAQGDLVQWIE